MSQRKNTKKSTTDSIPGTRRNLFINSPYDDVTGTSIDLGDEGPSSHGHYVPISDTVRHIEPSSPRNLNNLKSPKSSIMSPIRLPEEPLLAERLQTGRPMSPRAASPKAIEPQATSPRAVSPRRASPKATSPRVVSPRATEPKEPVRPTDIPPVVGARSNIPKPVNNIRKRVNVKPVPNRTVPSSIDITPSVDVKAISPQRSSTDYSHVAKSQVNNIKIVASPRRDSPKSISPKSKKIYSPKVTKSPSRPVSKGISPKVSQTTSAQSIDVHRSTPLKTSSTSNRVVSPKVHSPRVASPLPISARSELESRWENAPIGSEHKRHIYSPKIKSSPIAMIEDLSSTDTTPVVRRSYDNPIITPIRHKRDITEESVSSRLPKIADRTHIVIDETPPRRDTEQFVPSIGDELTRNGIRYVYSDQGWIASDQNWEDEGEEPLPVEVRRTEGFMKDIPDYDLLTADQQVYIRAKFVVKFGMIRETWPQYEIPIPSGTMSLKHMHIMYNHYVKHIYARENAQTYMLYVVAGWLVMEIVAVKLLNLPAGKFTEFRMNRMGKYKILLIQLGEKYHGEFGEGWPVEVKILMMSLIEMIVFIAVRWFLGSLNDTGVATSVDTISTMIDRYFGITGINNPDRPDNIPPPPDYNGPVDHNLPQGPQQLRIPIPELPEPSSNVSDALGWIPTITGALGLNNNTPNNPPPVSAPSNNIADKVRARVANRKRVPGKPGTPHMYDPPPFDS